MTVTVYIGKKGFEKFLDSHKCNAICQYLELQPINPKSEKNDMGTFPRPELDLESLVIKSDLKDNNNSVSPSQRGRSITPPTSTLSVMGYPFLILSFFIYIYIFEILRYHGNTMSSETSHILKRKSWGEREREKEKEKEEEEINSQLRRASAKVIFYTLFPCHY